MGRGQLRIYLGAAPGVGKTFAMLNEARRRRDRGADVVIGIVETHGRALTAAQIGDLEVIPRVSLEYRGTTLDELDLAAVIKRKPEVVAIDELAHTNAPGSMNQKRWQDIEQILDAGIDVISTVNIQHLESLNDVVAQITGITQNETVPDRVVRKAEQIELVDMSPEALRRRMAHGNIYPPERADAALANFFRPGNLGALRELALLWLADRVEQNLGDYLNQHGLTESWETRERVVVGLTGAPGADHVIRRAARIAQRVGGELIGVHVSAPDARISANTNALGDQFKLLESLGGSRREVLGDDRVASLVAVARSAHATQIVIGATSESRWQQLRQGSFAARLSRIAQGIDIHIVAIDAADEAVIPPRTPDGKHSLSPGSRRTWASIALLAVGLPALTGVLHLVRDHVGLSTELLLYLVLVMGVAMIGGRLVAMIAALAAALVVNYFFVDPLYTLSVTGIDNAVALVTFVVIGLVIGALVDRVAAQASAAGRSRSEAAILARTAAVLIADPDPVAHLMDAALETFDIQGATLLQSSTDGESRVVATAGNVASPAYTIEVGASPSGDDRRLMVSGRPLTADDQRVLSSFAAQLGVAIDRELMRLDSQKAKELSAIDLARTALLRAVSHDLRTPLATIKALSSGLLDGSVSWQQEQLDEMYVTIDGEADRLNRLISNLLDASRLEAGLLAVSLEPVDLASVIDLAVASLTHRPTHLAIDLPLAIPQVFADRSLLERAIANLVDNAARYCPAKSTITVTGAQIGETIHLCVIDRGVGIPAYRRAAVIESFQRLDDSGTAGVGLGLAIVEGVVRAMHGKLLLDDTPGGGLTATIILAVAAPMPTPLAAESVVTK